MDGIQTTMPVMPGNCNNGLGGIGLFGLIGLRGIGGLGEDGAGNSYQAGVVAGQNATKMDLFDTQSSINSNVNFTADRTSGQIFDLSNRISAMVAEQASCCCEVKTGILESSYQNLLNMTNMENRLAVQQTAGTQAVLDKLCEQETAALSRALNEAERERDFLRYGNLPLVQSGSVVTTNPCATNSATEQINIINQNVAAIGSTVNQLAGIVSGLVQK